MIEDLIKKHKEEIVGMRIDNNFYDVISVCEYGIQCTLGMFNYEFTYDEIPDNAKFYKLQEIE